MRRALISTIIIGISLALDCPERVSFSKRANDPAICPPVCGVQGPLVDRTQISHSRKTNFDDCKAACLEDERCLSFAHNKNNRCRLYSGTITEQGGVSPPVGKGNQMHYDVACFTNICIDCQPLKNGDFSNGLSDWIAGGRGGGSVGPVAQFSFPFTNSAEFDSNNAVGIEVAILQQVITPLIKGANYTLRYVYNSDVVFNTVNENCVLDVRMDNDLVDTVSFNGVPNDHQWLTSGRLTYIPNAVSQQLSFTSTCQTVNSASRGQILIDEISFTAPSSTGCRT